MGYILIFISLIGIIYQDFSTRQIHLGWLMGWLTGICITVSINWMVTLINLLLISFQLLLLTLYFSLKEKRLVYLPDVYLGWGDILFFIPLCIWFSTGNLVLFFIIGFLGTLVGFVIFRLFRADASPFIPLAGCLSIFLLFLMGLHCCHLFNFEDENLMYWVVQYR